MENQLCITCGKEPVFIKKSGLGGKCYRKLRRISKNGVKITRKITKSESRKSRINALINKYGREILDDFISLNKNPYYKLSHIAFKYGFSREYARKLYIVIFDTTYTKIKNSKLLLKNTDLSCLRDPRNKIANYNLGSNVGKGAIIEKLFFDECQKRKLTIEFCNNNTIDIKINGFYVDVKGCFTPMKPKPQNKTPHFRYGITKNQIKQADFFACFHQKENCFFIIPNEWKDTNIDLKSQSWRQGIYIAVVKTNYKASKNRYWEYRNAWHLLKETKN